MLDRTPTGRRRKPAYIGHMPPEVKALTRVMKAFERLTLGATVVHTEEQGVLVQYDPKDFDRVTALLATLEDDEDGHDDEPATGSRQLRWYAGILYELDDAEHDGSEQEEGEPELGWTEQERRFGCGKGMKPWTVTDGEPSLGSTAAMNQTHWSAGDLTAAADDRERDDADNPKGEHVDEDGGENGDHSDSGLCGFAPFDGVNQSRAFKPAIPGGPVDFSRGKRKVIGVMEGDLLRVVADVVIDQAVD